MDYDNGAVLNMKFNNITNEDESLIAFHGMDRTVAINFTKHFANKHRFTDGQVVRREFTIPKESASKIEIINFINSCQNLDLQNIYESPAELRIIQTAHSIKDRIFQSAQHA